MTSVSVTCTLVTTSPSAGLSLPSSWQSPRRRSSTCPADQPVSRIMTVPYAHGMLCLAPYGLMSAYGVTAQLLWFRRHKTAVDARLERYRTTLPDRQP